MDANSLLEQYQRLESARGPWESHWRDIAEYVQPRKANLHSHYGGGANDGTPDLYHHNRLFDTTAVDANLVLARGQIAWLTPRETQWFEFAAHQEELQEIDRVKDWLNRATMAARIALAKSNWDTEIHECYLDIGAFGTTALFCDWNAEKQLLEFRCLPPTSYVAAENGRHEIDTVMRSRRLSHRNAAELFGIDNLPPDVAKMAGNPHDWHHESEYLHCIFPRRDGNALGLLATDLPWASVWLHRDSEHVILESGYATKPCMVARFLRWTGLSDTDAPYGWSPAWAALGDIRQLNYLEKTLDALADRQVNPPVLWPDDLDSRADLRPGGKTLYDPLKGDAGIPREWMSQGQYPVGQMRAEEKRERVRRHFMVSLFEMFAQLDRSQMTATEVNARLQEKVDQFSPTFHLRTTELLTPVLGRVFQLLMTTGQLPGDVPEELLVPDEETGQVTIDLPKVNYTSRLALAITAAQDAGVLRTLEVGGQLAEIDPGILMNIDLDQFIRDFFRHNGGSPDHLRDQAEVAQMREAIMQQQMAAQQQEGAAA